MWVSLNQFTLFDMKFFTKVEIPIEYVRTVSGRVGLADSLFSEHGPSLPADSAQDAGSHSPASMTLRPKNMTFSLDFSPGLQPAL